MRKRGGDGGYVKKNMGLHIFISIQIDSLLTLSYSSKMNGYLYHQRVSPPLKDTLRPDFQANARPRIILKPMSPQDTGRQL